METILKAVSSSQALIQLFTLVVTCSVATVLLYVIINIEE